MIRRAASGRGVRKARTGARDLLALALLLGVVAACDGAADRESAGLDSSELVFVSDRDGTGLDVYVQTMDGSGTTRLTSDEGTDYGPVWSPDGERILFTSTVDGDSDIYVVDADGSNRRNLSRSPSHDGGPSFSPDGREIVFTSAREPTVEGHSGRDLWLMDADGSNLRRLTENEMYDDAANFSPDGQRIAFCRQLPPVEEGGPSNGDIFVMNRDGSDQRRLTSAETFDCLPDWSPDGERIAFHGCGPDGCRLFVVPAEGGEPTPVPTPHPANWPVWSPDGEWIAYTGTHDDQTDIWIVRTDGSETRQITSQPGRDEVADWRPAR